MRWVLTCSSGPVTHANLLTPSGSDGSSRRLGHFERPQWPIESGVGYRRFRNNYVEEGGWPARIQSRHLACLLPGTGGLNSHPRASWLSWFESRIPPRVSGACHPLRPGRHLDTGRPGGGFGLHGPADDRERDGARGERRHPDRGGHEPLAVRAPWPAGFLQRLRQARDNLMGGRQLARDGVLYVAEFFAESAGHPALSVKLAQPATRRVGGVQTQPDGAAG